MEGCGFVFCHGDVIVPGAVAVCSSLSSMEGWEYVPHSPPFPPLNSSQALRLLWAPFSALHDADGPLGSFLRFLSQQDSAS